MTMTDDGKNGKKDGEGKSMRKDDLFGGMDDVIGERKISEAQETPVKEKAPEPVPPKVLNHKKLEATTVSSVAEQNMIWLTVGDVTYTIDEISPENFIEWVYDKLPGLKKKRTITPEQCSTARQRIDIFEEVVSILTRWFHAAQAKKDNPLDF